MIVECQCPASGFCETLKRQMVGRPFQICHGDTDLPEWKRDAYVAQWSGGTATSTGGTKASKLCKKRRGPGTQLLKIYQEAGIPSCQGCHDLARRMDEWGPDECEKRLDSIVQEILPRAKEWVKTNKRWVHKFLPNSVEDFGIKRELRKTIIRAIEEFREIQAETESCLNSQDSIQPKEE